ncbi:ABC transporter ATP-binding protein [Serratia grimesii]|uniref:ABC transporter ATP-binding protein n=1 Tax=Serratia grimesii TaxID=82995 RepID=UPI0022406D88|nr:ABC transporter ATP-binding protein [Serratia grimesii]
MITVEQLSFGFKGSRKVINNISFHLEKGDILCVMGPNGAGKTTLLKSLSGIYQPVSGACVIEDVDNRKARLAYVPQAKKLHFSYSVLDFVSFGCSQRKGFFSKPGKEDFDRSSEILNRLDVGRLRGKCINQISGGELQMCYFAKALVAEPDVIVLDEPESNLDFQNQAKVIDMLWELSRERKVTVIFNTHFINYAESISDKCLLMDKEHYIFGEKNALLQEEYLEEYFQVPVRKYRYEGEGGPDEAFVIRPHKLN